MLPFVRLLDGSGDGRYSLQRGYRRSRLRRRPSDTKKRGRCRNVTEARRSLHGVTGHVPRLTHFELPPPHAPPLTSLVPNVLVAPDPFKAERLVDADACVVREGDARHQQPEAALLQPLEQRQVELAADAAALSRAIDVRADLDGPVVRGAGTVRPAVRVADHAPIAFCHEPLGGGADPLGHLGCRRRFSLERDRAVGYVRLVDRRTGGRVVLGVCFADRQAAVGPEGASSPPPPPAGPASCSAVSGGGGVSAGAGAGASAGVAGCSAAAVPAVAGASAGWPPSGASGVAVPPRSASGAVTPAAGVSDGGAASDGVPPSAS